MIFEEMKIIFPRISKRIRYECPPSHIFTNIELTLEYIQSRTDTIQHTVLNGWYLLREII